MFDNAARKLKGFIEKCTLAVMFLLGSAIIIFFYIFAREYDSGFMFIIGLLIAAVVLFFIWLSVLLIIAFCDMMCDVKEIKRFIEGKVATGEIKASNNNRRNNPNMDGNEDDMHYMPITYGVSELILYNKSWHPFLKDFMYNQEGIGGN